MKSFKTFFLEARRNPELNPKDDPNKILEPYLGNENYFISFRWGVDPAKGIDEDYIPMSEVLKYPILKDLYPLARPTDTIPLYRLIERLKDIERLHDPSDEMQKRYDALRGVINSVKSKGKWDTKTKSWKPIDTASFFSPAKMGINPKSKYNTPNSLYTYPLGVLGDFIKNAGVRELPYQAEAPHIFLIKKTTDKILDLTKISKEEVIKKIEEVLNKNPEYKNYFIQQGAVHNIKILEEMIYDLNSAYKDIEKYIKNSHVMIDGMGTEESLEDIYDYISKHKTITKNFSMANQIDYAFDLKIDETYTTKMVVDTVKKIMLDFVQSLKEQKRELSQADVVNPQKIYNMGESGRATNTEYPGGILWWFFYTIAGGEAKNLNPNKWTKLMLDAGYDMALDRGASIIHANEPSQAAFFKRAFKVEKIIENRIKTSDSRKEDYILKKYKKILTSGFSHKFLLNVLLEKLFKNSLDLKVYEELGSYIVILEENGEHISHEIVHKPTQFLNAFLSKLFQVVVKNGVSTDPDFLALDDKLTLEVLENGISEKAKNYILEYIDWLAPAEGDFSIAISNMTKILNGLEKLK